MPELALTYGRSNAVSLRGLGHALIGSHRAQAVTTIERAQPVRVTMVHAWEQVARDRLQRLMALPTGWDGYRSSPVSPSIARFAINVLNSVMGDCTPYPSIVPVAGGGVQIEWHEGGFDIELRISAPLKAELYVEFADGRDAIEKMLKADFSELSAILGELT